MRINRREWIKGVAVTTSGALLSSAVADEPKKNDPRTLDLRRQLGITTGSFMRHLTVEPKPGKLRLLDLPKIMHNELDMHVIDLMTATLASNEPAYLDELRNEADKNNCVLTNLKLNYKEHALENPDPTARRAAVDAYRKGVDLAARLGVRWVRPLPGNQKPDLAVCTAAFHELMDYAAERKIQVIVENNGWMKNDPDAIPALIKAVGRNLAVSPDTGNWNEAARYEGLKKAFPYSVTCDFKALELGPNGEHKAYDLKRCFDIAWSAGFRGPWCFEHFHDDLSQLFREFGMLRDWLKQWMKESGS